MKDELFDERDVIIRGYDGRGYLPLVDYGEWRVALLNSDTEYLPENISYAQQHLFTDEVFVLLQGECTLITFGDGDSLSEMRLHPMRQHLLYNVKKCVWHTHALSPGAKVLIVENRDTTEQNSPILPLDNVRRTQMLDALLGLKQHKH